MDVPIFLVHFDPAGVKTYIELTRYAQRSVFYLPDAAASDLGVSQHKDNLHSKISLELEAEHSLLSVYSSEPSSTFVLGTNNIEMPLSTISHQKSIILTQEHQFITPAGRWRLQWDLDNSISNSMRPPELPSATATEEGLGRPEIEETIELVPLEQGEGLADEQDMSELSNTRRFEPVQVTEIHLSPAPSDASETLDMFATGEDLTHVTKSGMTHASDIALDTVGDPRPRIEPTTKMSNTSDASSGEDQNHSLELNDDDPATHCAEKLDCARQGEDTVNSTKIPRAWREQETGQAELIPTAIVVQTIASPSRNESPKLKIIKSSNVLHPEGTNASENDQDDEETASENDQDDEETASESDSQLQQDNRKPKRTLSEIEQDDSPLQRKKARMDGAAIESITQKKQPADNGQLQSLNLSQTPAVDSVKKAVTWKDLIDTRKPHTRPEPEDIQHANMSFTPEPALRASSRRRSVTPVNPSASSPRGYGYGAPKVIFGSTSTIPKNKKIMSIIMKLGGSVVSDINEADVLCIGKGSIKKSSKFVIAVARGKDIVTDDWLKQAHAEQKFPERRSFLPKDEEHEQGWKFKLEEAIDRGKQGLNLLKETHVYLTSQLRRDLGNLSGELKQVARALGAAATHNGLPKKNTKTKVLVIGSSKNVDPQAANVGRLGHKLYGQDILTMAALRGHLETGSKEFMLDVPVKDEPSSE